MYHYLKEEEKIVPFSIINITQSEVLTHSYLSDFGPHKFTQFWTEIDYNRHNKQRAVIDWLLRVIRSKDQCTKYIFYSPKTYSTSR